MQSKNLSDTVTGYILRYVREKQLVSGDKLLSEVQTSATLKISRGIVREAYRSLSAAGIIEVVNGRSPRVGVLNGVLLTNLMHHALSTRQVSLEQVLDLRGSIEVHAAELAAKTRNERDIKQLRTAVAGMKKAILQPEKFVLHDVHFHETINGATGNPLVPIIGRAMRECMAESIRAGLDSRVVRAERGRRSARLQIAQVVETHSEIVDAIEAGRTSRARDLMKRHFGEAKRALRSAVDEE